MKREKKLKETYEEKEEEEKKKLEEEIQALNAEPETRMTWAETKKYSTFIRNENQRRLAKTEMMKREQIS